MADGPKCKIVCDYHTERRPFTAKDAGRVICYAVQDGASLREILNHAAQRCKVTELDCDCEKLQQIIRLAEGALAVAVAILIAMSPLRRIILQRLPNEIKRLPKKEREAIEGVFRRLPDSQELLTKVQNELSLAERELAARARAIQIIEP